MSFKLRSDSISDRPLIICDVCSQPIYDLFGDKASASPAPDEQLKDVTIHHAACSAPGTVHMPLIDFFRLFTVQNRLGDLGTDEVQGVLTDKVSVEYPNGRGFEA